MDAAIRLFRDACGSSHAFLSAGFLEANAARLRERTLLAFTTEVAEDDGICGFICHAEGFVEALFVHPQRQGRGIGRALIDHLKARHAALRLSVFAQNARAIRFYRREHFWAAGLKRHRETGEQLVMLHLDARWPELSPATAAR